MTGRRYRIAAFSAVDLSLPQGHAVHLRGLLDALTERGHAVSLVTPRPAVPAPQTRFSRIEIPVLRIGVLVHWSFELMGGVALLVRALRQRPDLIYARHDLYTVAPAIVGALLGIPVVAEVNAAIPVEIGLWGRRRARRVVAACERFSLRRAAAIFVLSDGLGRDLAERVGVDAKRIRKVEIAASLPEAFDPEAVRSAEGVAAHEFVVGFAGNLSPVQGVDLLVRAAAEARREGIRLWIIGDGVEGIRLRSIAGPAVRFFGGVSREESDRLLAGCQILAAPYRREAFERVYGGAVSTKILTYLASDRPILASEIESYRWIEALGCGELCREEDLSRSIARWHDRWVEAGRPLRDWPWTLPGPGRRWVEGNATWDRAAARVEVALGELLTFAGR